MFENHFERFYFPSYSFPNVCHMELNKTPFFLNVEGSHTPCGNYGKHRNMFLKNVAWNLVPEEPTVSDLVWLFGIFFLNALR